jgi:hypothetical protein
MSGPRALTRYDTSLKAPRLSSKSPIATQAGRHSALRQYGCGAKCALLYPDQAAQVAA